LSRPKIYLGGAISGRNFDEVQAERERWTAILTRLQFEVIDPVVDEEIELDAEGRADFPKTKAGVEVTPEQTAVMDLEQVYECDIVLFLLDYAERISIGCVSEQGVARGRGIPSVVLRDSGGVHDHGFVNGLADFVTDDEAVLVAALARWAANWNVGMHPCLT
jgi:nucleoside 2-deoxyribosyltransferase